MTPQNEKVCQIRLIFFNFGVFGSGTLFSKEPEPRLIKWSFSTEAYFFPTEAGKTEAYKVALWTEAYRVGGVPLPSLGLFICGNWLLTPSSGPYEQRGVKGGMGLLFPAPKVTGSPSRARIGARRA